MNGKKLLLSTEIFLGLVMGGVVLFTNAYIEPLIPLKQILKRNWIFLGIMYVFLILVFKLIEHYYSQLINHIKKLNTLHEAMLKLDMDLKMDYRCGEALSILTEFYDGMKGILVITDPKIRRFVSREVFSFQRGVPRPTPGAARYRYNIVSPGKLSPEMKERVDALVKEYEFTAFRSIVVVPFFTEKETKAIAIVGTLVTDKKAFDDLRDVIDIFIKEVVTSLENSLLHEEVHEASITDPLTTLYNRRYFQVRLREEFAEAKRRGFPVSIMISDLDNFKHYVDTYGHPKGDVILYEVARIVRSCLRESDVVCRFGGDEFSYLLPYSSSLEAKTVAERMRKAVADYGFLKGEKSPVQLTLSIGIATFPEHGTTEEEILRKADAALFRAKERGKDTIETYQQPEERHGSVR